MPPPAHVAAPGPPVSIYQKSLLSLIVPLKTHNYYTAERIRTSGCNGPSWERPGPCAPVRPLALPPAVAAVAAAAAAVVAAACPLVPSADSCDR